jgi:cytochrome c oxidase subunit 2
VAGLNRHAVQFLVLWAILTAAFEAFALLDFYPTVGAPEAEDSDGIFQLLLFMGLPVFAFVVAALAYSMYAFRAKTAPAGNEGGPTIRGTGAAPRVWLAITGGLALLVMIHPGLTGLAALQGDDDGYGWGDPNAELVVNVNAFRFSWEMKYEGTGVTVNTAVGQELVLPVDREVTFRVNSIDVIHSFWIPAFRLKIDAIPGRTTFFSVEPSRVGAYADDSAYRVQCAELCGVDHTLMRFPVRVVEQDEFEAWLASLAGEAN